MSEDHSTGPADLLRAAPSLSGLARAAGLNVKTLLIARDTNTWPAQRRTREALRRVLGIDAPPTFPVTINSVEECEAVLARLKASQSAPRPVADAIPQPV